MIYETVAEVISLSRHQTMSQTLLHGNISSSISWANWGMFCIRGKQPSPKTQSKVPESPSSPLTPHTLPASWNDGQGLGNTMALTWKPNSQCEADTPDRASCRHASHEDRQRERAGCRHATRLTHSLHRVPSAYLWSMAFETRKYMKHIHVQRKTIQKTFRKINSTWMCDCVNV